MHAEIHVAGGSRKRARGRHTERKCRKKTRVTYQSTDSGSSSDEEWIPGKSGSSSDGEKIQGMSSDQTTSMANQIIKV